jgi:hypothetical protein
MMSELNIPRNCWLDDEPEFCPSPCVFDDPSEDTDNCVYARKILLEGTNKFVCRYYRVPENEQPSENDDLRERVKDLEEKVQSLVNELKDLLPPDPRDYVGEGSTASLTGIQNLYTLSGGRDDD